MSQWSTIAPTRVTRVRVRKGLVTIEQPPAIDVFVLRQNKENNKEKRMSPLVQNVMKTLIQHVEFNCPNLCLV